MQKSKNKKGANKISPFLLSIINSLGGEIIGQTINEINFPIIVF